MSAVGPISTHARWNVFDSLQLKQQFNSAKLLKLQCSNIEVEYPSGCSRSWLEISLKQSFRRLAKYK